MTEIIIPYYNWVIAGFVLMLFETLTPGFFALWIGLAAVIVGIISWFFPELNFIITGSLFILLAAVISWYGKVIYKRLRLGSNKTLNQWDAQFIGNAYPLDTPMKNGRGKVRIGDGVWPVKSEDKGLDLPEGKQVRVISSDGIHLIVQPATVPAVAAAPARKKPAPSKKKPVTKGKKNERRRK
ncbi:MAG: NfeD family protein [Alphaproteobacteria bacterium]|nr:NfeD family protein [Alphaproteobacteria bacterium]